MKHIISLSILSILLSSCNESTENTQTLISSFGEQPSISKSALGEIEVVFSDEESIYYSSSKDQGGTFSQPSLVAKLEGLVVGFSSGPTIANTGTSVVITAPDAEGNLYAWSRPVETADWSGPFRINDVDKSAAEALSDLASAPNGQVHCVWIDTRILEDNSHQEHAVAEPESHSAAPTPKVAVDLTEMTPLGITKGELFERIGDIPENSILSFHADNEGKLYWVLFDKDKNVLKAESPEEYRIFRERNAGNAKLEGKIYLSSSADGGKTWSKSKLVYRSPDGSVCECCKPSIISDNDGNITIMFRNNVAGARDLHFTQSVDGGATFSIPEKLGTGTWKINGCPMDGGGLTANSAGELNTIWQRKGAIYLSKSSSSETRIGAGRGPSLSANAQKTYVVFSDGEDIISTTVGNSSETKMGTGTAPKVIALEHGAVYFWVNKKGINFKKVL
jgi:hypothetical protein